MIKKIFLVFLIITILYGVSVFALPDISAKIDWWIGVPGLSNTLRWKKSSLDSWITNIPNKQEFQSGATDAKNKFIDGVQITKDKIDDIRTKAQEAEDLLNSSKETYDQAKEVYDDAQWKLEQVQEIMDTAQSVKWSGSVSQ